jgi:spore maturation protein CgeB
MKSHRILVIGPSYKGTLPESYARAFERLGMEVVHFDDERELFRAASFANNRVLRRAFRSRLWAKLNRATIETAEAVRPSLIFAVRASYLEAETVAGIRKSLGVAFVNHYPDNPYIGVPLDPREPSTQRRDLIDVLREYSTVWMWERTLLQRLKEDRVAAEFLPFGVDPELFRPQAASESLLCEDCGREHDVVFVGTYTRSRLSELARVRQHSVAIWGNSWPKIWKSPLTHRSHAPVYGNAVARIYGAAPISLNVLNAESLEGHNMRTFEVPASGGVMLARYTLAQAEFFPENEAAAYYRSPDEIDSKIEWLLGDAALRERIRRNGVQLAASHTYDHRAAEVLRHEGLLDASSVPQIRAAALPK